MIVAYHFFGTAGTIATELFYELFLQEAPDEENMQLGSRPSVMHLIRELGPDYLAQMDQDYRAIHLFLFPSTTLSKQEFGAS